MISDEQVKDEHEKIVEGLKLVRERLIVYKRYKKSPIIVSRNGKIIELDPFEIPLESEKNQTKPNT